MTLVKNGSKWIINTLINAGCLHLLRFVDEGGLCILFYHGFRQDNIPAGSILNYDGKHVDIEKFSKQIRYLKKNYDIISLSEALNLLRSRKKL